MYKSAGPAEPIIEPDLPIIDPHHHLWYWDKASLEATATSDNPFAVILRTHGRYMIEEFLQDLTSGHNILGTVFVEAHAMYKASGPEHLKTLGEVEWVTGQAAAAESGRFGPIRVAGAIVGHAPLSLGDAADEVLDMHIRAAGGRYRGVRNPSAYDADAASRAIGTNQPNLLSDKNFRAGFKYLAKKNLSYDCWILEPQIPELIDLARAFPDTQIILDHVGTPFGHGKYAGKHAERFPTWRKNMSELATCPNVAVKLGGLAMGVCGLPSFQAKPRFSSEQLAAEWKPYIESCIELFGVNRCMFESNYPVDSGAADYPVLWNAFKRLSAGASKDEKAALYAGTARRIYRLDF